MANRTSINVKQPGCYWCGHPATSREHVPPSNLFPPGHNNQLITVPSCRAHNEDLHLIDDRFRLYLQALETNAHALNAFKDKTMRGLNRPESERFVRSLAERSHRITVQGKVTLAMEIDPGDQNTYFEKITRGLYFHCFGKQAKGRVTSASEKFIVPGFDYSELKNLIVPYLNDPATAVFGITANPEIFQFKYARQVVERGDYFAVVMRFYEGVEVFGLLTP